MAEEVDLKSIQCQFESDQEDLANLVERYSMEASKESKVVSTYLEMKNQLDSISVNALAAAYDFGYLMGVKDTEEKLKEENPPA